MHTDSEPSETFRANCLGCPVQDCAAGDKPGGLPLAGWRLGLVSMGLFLGPCVLAIVGAACFSQSHGAQFLGAIAGLAVGMTSSVLIAAWLHRADEAESIKKSV